MNALLATPLAKEKAYRGLFEVAASRNQELSDQLATIIRSLSKDEKVAWADVITWVVDGLKIEPDQLRLIARVSLSTISRWRSGESEPHSLLRESIGEALSLYVIEQGKR
jgi:hypothetical protein